MWFTFTCSFDTWIRDFYSTFTFTKVIFDLITLSPRWCFVHSSSLWILPQFFLSKSASCGFRRVGTRAEKPKLELQNFFFGSKRIHLAEAPIHVLFYFFLAAPGFSFLCDFSSALLLLSGFISSPICSTSDQLVSVFVCFPFRCHSTPSYYRSHLGAFACNYAIRSHSHCAETKQGLSNFVLLHHY